MRSDLYNELRAVTAGEYELLGELDGDREWMAYLARALADGSLAVLVLERAGGGAFDLRVVSELDATPRPIGRTRCGWCAVEMDGWPRVCDGCGRDLSGLAPEVALPGSPAADLLDGVRAAAEEEGYEVLGAMGAAKGGGALYFARERAAGRIVGLVLRQGQDGSELSLDPSWSQDEVALASPTLLEPVDTTELATPTKPLDEPVEPVRPHGAPDWGSAEEQHFDPALPRPERRRRWYAVGGVALAAAAVLVPLLSTRGTTTTGKTADPGQEDVASAPPTHAPPLTLPPVPPPVDSTRPERPQTAVADSPRSTPRRPVRRRERLPHTDSVPPAAARPDSVPAKERRPPPEVDRKQIIAALEQYVRGLRTRRVEEMQDAYPGMPDQDVRRWRNFFGKIRGFSLLVTDEIQEPAVDGDAASVVFQVRLDYNGRRETLRSRATLERTGSGWVIRAINGP